MDTGVLALNGSILFFLLATGSTAYLLRLKCREKEALNFRVAEIYTWVLMMLPWCVQATLVALDPMPAPEPCSNRLATGNILILHGSVVYAQSCAAVINWVLRRPAESGALSLLRSIWSTFLACITGLFCLAFFWMLFLMLASLILRMMR